MAERVELMKFMSLAKLARLSRESRADEGHNLETLAVPRYLVPGKVP